LTLGSSVFVIVPAYNDAPIIRSTIKQLLDLNYKVVVVDDGSSDDTWLEVSVLPVYLLHHRINLGQGAALQTGMTFALQEGAEILVHFDADGKHQAADISTLIDALLQGESEVVFGSRFLRKTDRGAVPFFRRLLLKIGVVVNGISTGVWLSDAHNGLRALSATAARQLELKENGYAHATEILAQVRKLNLRYAERPTTIVYNDYSRATGQSMWNSLNIVFDLLVERLLK